MKEEVFVESTSSRAPSLMRRVSWGAIFAGLLVTVVIQMMLTLLGIGIGAASIDPLREQNPGQGLAIGSAIWLIASALIAVFIGSCIAGRLSGGPRASDGLLHGVVTWSAATMLTVAMLVSAAGVVIGGTSTLLSGLVKGGAKAAQNGGMDSAMAALQQSKPNDGMLSPTGRESGPTGQLATMAKQNPQLGVVLAKMEKNGGASQSPADRDQAVQMLTQQGLNQEQAAQLVSQWDQQFQQTKAKAGQKAREVEDKAARGVSRGAIMGFIALLLELGVAAWGGWAGAASLARMRTERVVSTGTA
jgi:hypothetical protein